jgi:hypothetical protein
MAGYSPDVIRDFAKRFGSIANAEEKARTVPGFGEEIRRVDVELTWLSTHWREPPGAREKLEDERRSLVVEALKEDAPRRPGARRRGPGRGGTDYAGPGVEDVVRRAHAAVLGGANLGPTLRDKIAAEANVTTYESGLIFDLIESGTLADADREGWLLIDGQLSSTPPVFGEKNEAREWGSDPGGSLAFQRPSRATLRTQGGAAVAALPSIRPSGCSTLRGSEPQPVQRLRQWSRTTPGR